MAKRPDLTSHQRGIVKRYYAHKDTIMAGKLGEMVSELFLLEAGGEGGSKKAQAMWKRVETALKQTDAPAARVDRVVGSRDLRQLADLVNALAG